MKLTQHQLQEIKQRLVHVNEEHLQLHNSNLAANDPETFREEIAYQDGRINELEWIINLLEEIDTKEKRSLAIYSEDI